MSYRNPELDRLKSEQQSLFRQKQAAFQRFKSLQEQTIAAHDTMQSAWDERVRTRAEMNREFEARKSAYSHRNSVWDEYSRIRDYKNSKMDSLRQEADAEHRAMQVCFGQASNAYQYGDKSEAPHYSQQGHDHKARRDELNAEISKLAREIKQARANAEALAPRVDSFAFNCAKSAFGAAKMRHELSVAEFKRLKSMRDAAKTEFDRLHEQFKQAQAAFNSKLGEIRASKASKKQRIIKNVDSARVREKDKTKTRNT